MVRLTIVENGKREEQSEEKLFFTVKERTENNNFESIERRTWKRERAPPS